MSLKYSVRVNNRAAHSDYLMVFQDNPGSFDRNAMALAWFSKFSNPGPNVVVEFEWTVNWGFSWADTGTLGTGIVYKASDQRPAGPGNNQISLDYNGAYFFSDQQAGPDPDRYFIAEKGNIPVNASGSVGITMDGKTVYATQARPNTNITASPRPSYFLAYGNFAEGTVVDISTINNPLKLEFRTGIYSLETTLNADLTWETPVPISERNEAFLKAREGDSDLQRTDSF